MGAASTASTRCTARGFVNGWHESADFGRALRGPPGDWRGTVPAVLPRHSNGQKVGILLEEIGLPYDAHVIRIARLQQFTSGFVAINPNSKIPAAVDLEPVDGSRPVRLFESASIMLYLAEKYGKFIPSCPRKKAECMNWIMWQTSGQGPMTGNFGHFFVYAPDDKWQHASMEWPDTGWRFSACVRRWIVLSGGREFICGSEYTIADMCILPWFDLIREEWVHARERCCRKETFSI